MAGEEGARRRAYSAQAPFLKFNSGSFPSSYAFSLYCDPRVLTLAFIGQITRRRLLPQSAQRLPSDNTIDTTSFTKIPGEETSLGNILRNPILIVAREKLFFRAVLVFFRSFSQLAWQEYQLSSGEISW